MLDQKLPSQPILTLKFEIMRGMKLVKEHVEAAAHLLGISDGGLVLGMIIEFNFAKLLINKQKVPNISDFCSDIKREIIPGVILTWAREDDRRTFNVVIKGLAWNVPNSLVKAYLEIYGDVTKDGVKWGDMSDPSWLAETNPATGTHSKLASGERLARIITTRRQIPRDHILNGKRFYIEHKGQRTCRNCLEGPINCKSACDERAGAVSSLSRV